MPKIVSGDEIERNRKLYYEMGSYSKVSKILNISAPAVRYRVRDIIQYNQIDEDFLQKIHLKLSIGLVL